MNRQELGMKLLYNELFQKIFSKIKKKDNYEILINNIWMNFFFSYEILLPQLFHQVPTTKHWP